MPRTRSTPSRRSFVASVCALEGGGKTQFGLSGTGKKCFCSVDPNSAAVIEKFYNIDSLDDLDADEIEFHKIKYPMVAFSDQDDIQKEAEAAWEGFIDLMRPIYKGQSDVRTVIVDTASEFDNLNVLAEFGKSDQITPESRRNRMGPVNRRWSGWIRGVNDAGVNVILLHRLKRRWETVERRGQGGTTEVRQEMNGPWDYDRIGHKDTGFDNSVEIYLRHDPEKSEKLPLQFGARIMRCTLRPALIGTELWGREKLEDGSRLHRATFPWVASLVYPNTTLDSWR